MSVAAESESLTAVSYFLRGFGLPLFAFSILSWINHVVPQERNAVAVGMLVLQFGANEQTGLHRIAPEGESTGRILASGLIAAEKEPRLVAGMVIRLINTAPEFGMFIIMPTIIANELGWGQSRWLTMTVVVYAGNILFNAAFGAIGDRIGWIRTVKWFGIAAAAVGLLAWWYVAHLVPAGSTWGFWVTTASTRSLSQASA